VYITSSVPAEIRELSPEFPTYAMSCAAANPQDVGLIVHPAAQYFVSIFGPKGRCLFWKYKKPFLLLSVSVLSSTKFVSASITFLSEFHTYQHDAINSIHGILAIVCACCPSIFARQGNIVQLTFRDSQNHILFTKDVPLDCKTFLCHRASPLKDLS
jgi:hypothetical protein